MVASSRECFQQRPEYKSILWNETRKKHTRQKEEQAHGSPNQEERDVGKVQTAGQCGKNTTNKDKQSRKPGWWSSRKYTFQGAAGHREVLLHCEYGRTLESWSLGCWPGLSCTMLVNLCLGYQGKTIDLSTLQRFF